MSNNVSNNVSNNKSIALTHPVAPVDVEAHADLNRDSLKDQHQLEGLLKEFTAGKLMRTLGSGSEFTKTRSVSRNVSTCLKKRGLLQVSL